MAIAKRPLGATGPQVTSLGFGGAPLGNMYRPISEQAVQTALTAAWDGGIRLFDTAPYYGFGLSERRMGDFLRHKPRADYVLSTKVGRLLLPEAGWHPARDSFIDALPFRPVYDYSYDGVMRSFEHSLQRLGLDSIDVLLMHDIGPVTHGADAHPALFQTAMQGGYRAMAALRDQGVVKSIGLGVNEWQVCAEAMDHGQWDCFLLAGRYTLLEQTALESFLPRCVAEGVGIIIGGAFNSGILATGPIAGAYYNYAPAPPEILARVGQIEAVCAQFGTRLPAAAAQFPLTHPAVASVIFGVSGPSDLAGLQSFMAEPVPPALWAALKEQGLLHNAAPVPVQREVA